MEIIHIQACGGVLFRKSGDITEVLMIYRRKYWDLPKGKLDAGESLEMCAAREVSEEVGIPFPLIVDSLGQTNHDYRENDILINKTTTWYVMVSNASVFTPQSEEEIEQVEWVPVNDAVKMAGFHNLRIVLDRFQKWLDRVQI